MRSAEYDECGQCMRRSGDGFAGRACDCSAGGRGGEWRAAGVCGERWGTVAFGGWGESAADAVLGGRCDLACPIDTVPYAIDHMALDASYRTNVTYVQFDAGHMMYINLPDLQKLQPVVEKFLKP